MLQAGIYTNHPPPLKKEGGYTHYKFKKRWARHPQKARVPLPTLQLILRMIKMICVVAKVKASLCLYPPLR